MKVYCVIEEYFFDGPGTGIALFSDYEKARECFTKKVEFERQNSWIDDYSDIEQSKDYFHAYDPSDYYETTIYIIEKEIIE